MNAPGPRLAIIADDLTGGLDTGVAFAARGWRTVLRIHEEERCLLPASPPPDVIVWDTETREANEETAARIARSVCAEPSVRGSARLYKKIDSTLRGPWLAELWEVSQAGARPGPVVLCPAFPAVGRTVVDGEARVHGQSLADAGFPGSGRLCDRLEGRWLGSVRFLASSEALAEMLSDDEPQPRLLVVDAATDRDLEALAATIETTQNRCLPCGAGGLAMAWARALIPDPDPLPPLAPVAGPVWVVAGSQHRATRQQMEALAESPDAHVEWIEAGAANLPARLRHLPGAATLGVALRQGDGRSRSAADPAFAAWAAECISGIAAEARQRGIGALVATGGETAALLLRAMGASTLRIDRELIPGIPLCQIADGPWAGTPLVTKAGGFGERDALIGVVARLHFESGSD
jgi:uncharacterized protein YgbK (DUF1537 family)